MQTKNPSIVFKILNEKSLNIIEKFNIVFLYLYNLQLQIRPILTLSLSVLLAMIYVLLVGTRTRSRTDASLCRQAVYVLLSLHLPHRNVSFGTCTSTVTTSSTRLVPYSGLLGLYSTGRTRLVVQEVSSIGKTQRRFF